MAAVALALLLEHDAGATCTYIRYRTRMAENPQCPAIGSGQPGCQFTADQGCTVCIPSCTVNGWDAYYLQPGPCGSIKQVAEDEYNCDTDEAVTFGAFPTIPNNTTNNYCSCAAVPGNGVDKMDNSIKPGSYGCEACATSGTSSKEPEMCDGKDQDNTAPFDEGCGGGEFCSAASDGDGAPIRYSSGRIESNPIVLYSLPSPEGLPFEYRIVWSSGFQRTTASTRTVNGAPENKPTIHHEDEDTHYVGTRWLDNFSDRLYIDVFGKASDKITWQSQNGTVTFSASTGWKSWSGRYELIDRGANPLDGFGQWVVRTTDASAPRQIWSFEEFSYTSYGGASYVHKLGRLRRRALLTSDVSNLTGRYGFTINWTESGAAGIIDKAIDTLGRELIFSYNSTVAGTNPAKTYAQSLRTIRYRPPGGTAQDVATLTTDKSNTVLERVERKDAPTWGYTRFLYKEFALGTNCVNCGALLTSVIVPSTNTNRPTEGNPSHPKMPTELQAIQPWEIELEGHEYGPSPDAPEFMLGVGSRYPGRAFGYQWSSASVTQLDLKQNGGSCGSGCSTGYACWTDGQCYVANVYTHDVTSRLPTGMTAASGTSSQAFSRVFDALGRVRRVTDASNTRTTYGVDTNGRVRCMVRGDDDDEAFANPGDPNNSACAGPAGSQVIQTNYTATSITKTFPSLLSGNVTETQNLDSTSLLLMSSTTSGKSRDIDGGTVTVDRTTTHVYDSIGRETETNGPLVDSTALDKSTTSYYTTFDAAWPNNFGRVYQTSVYVGTSSSNSAQTTTYSEYDVWGVPHRVTSPNGDKMLISASANRLDWTLVHEAADGSVSSTTVVQLNWDGTVRSVKDADGVCITYEYTDATGFVGAVTKMRRSTFGDGCGAPLTPLLGSGEVELRAYVNGDPDRLQSVTRQMNGVVAYNYSGFVYDRDRKLTGLATLDSASPFTLSYTDSLQTGVSAPSAPSGGAWQTDTTVDAFARATSFQRFLGGGNKQVFNFGYSSTLSPRPTSLTRGLNGAAASTTAFVYDDFAQLVETTVPESGAPGSPTATRYEYDVGGRMIKKRQGTGTASVRTDVYTYDSLGRTLAVDNDIEHDLSTCSGAPAGTAIEDFEYKYDNCDGDAPWGFSCSNAAGRLTMARTKVQCLGFFWFSKHGRWYDYDKLGRTARVAYAASNRSGAYPGPAIMEYSYTPAGRMQQYTSPLNSAFGTKYSFAASSGQVSAVETSSSTPSPIMSMMAYLPFGPLYQADTASLQSAGGGSVRKLQYTATYRTDYALDGQNWKFVYASGPSVPDIALMAQNNLGRTPAGAIATRYDAADVAASRYYGYDALLRLTCEARGSGSTNPTSGDCVTTSSQLSSLITYNDGADAAHPVDTRATSFTRTESGSYVSPTTEVASYLGGSSQLQSITRGATTMVIAHDGLGRRTYEYDSVDPVRSRRDYTYAPNGQLDSIVGRTPSNAIYGYSFRYDDRGRPITITTSLEGASSDIYALYWDDADRLIAASITMPYCRGTTMPPIDGCSAGYKSASWHYHYLGSELVAATHQLGSQTYRYWAAADERGLIHRLLDQNGGTVWQSRWDANGSRTAVSFLSSGSITEMWVPFGLPGQLVLNAMPIAQTVGGGGWTSSPGTEAFASGSGLTWTRPPIAINQWRPYDPLVGGFLQPDGADLSGRLSPESYLAFRSNPIMYADSTGADSYFAEYYSGGRNKGIIFDESCNAPDRLALTAAVGQAYVKLVDCWEGQCSVPWVKKNLLYYLGHATFHCGAYGYHFVGSDGIFHNAKNGERSLAGSHNNGSLANSRWNAYASPFRAQFDPNFPKTDFASKGCLARTVAHETYHEVLWRSPDFATAVGDQEGWGVFGSPYPFQSLESATIKVGRKVYGDLSDNWLTDEHIESELEKCNICD